MAALTLPSCTVLSTELATAHAHIRQPTAHATTLAANALAAAALALALALAMAGLFTVIVAGGVQASPDRRLC
jgi:hypothetical protein